MADTPLMKQYREIKSNFEDSILFFRLGDFYEMFFDATITKSVPVIPSSFARLYHDD